MYVLNETLKYVMLKKKLGYITAIDASKEFDKVNHMLLWIILFRKIGYRLTSSLVKYYGASKAYAMLSGQVSEIFSTSIGVKQGGPLSPRLFSLYIEEVVTLLDDLGHGIKVGNIVVNIRR